MPAIKAKTIPFIRVYGNKDVVCYNFYISGAVSEGQ
jgi:hypothetical protein